MKKQAKYRFSPTLLDSFYSYLNSSEVYNAYWGSSENPSKTEDEFEKEQLQSLIDRINRKPIAWEDSEAMDKGTAFNEVIDCLILNINSDKMEIKSDKETKQLQVKFNNRAFLFSTELCVNIAKRLEGAIPQYHIEGEVSTKYGDVYMHGYIDELMPFEVVDIKTTSKYTAFKYRDYWQRIVYPYLLQQNGINVTDFQFLVTDLKNVWSEKYTYNEVEDKPKLEMICEQLIEFIEANKDLITDKRIFNQQ